MDDLEHVAFFGPHTPVLSARHDLTISLDRDRAVGEPEVLHDAGERQPSRNIAGFAVNREPHTGYGGARRRGCQ
jgi:hypothetical protein